MPPLACSATATDLPNTASRMSSGSLTTLAPPRTSSSSPGWPEVAAGPYRSSGLPSLIAARPWCIVPLPLPASMIMLVHDAFAAQVALFDAIDPEDETGLDARGAYLLVWYADRIALIDQETHALSDPTEENCGHLDDAWKEAHYTPEFDRYYVDGDDFTDVPDDEFYDIIAWRLLEYHGLNAGLYQLAYDNLKAWDDL